MASCPLCDLPFKVHCIAADEDEAGKKQGCYLLLGVLWPLGCVEAAGKQAGAATDLDSR
jgi:hypothetical protein